jgi:hypothetical protein
MIFVAFGRNGVIRRVPRTLRYTLMGNSCVPAVRHTASTGSIGRVTQLSTARRHSC